jgi:hypothetical protein
MRVRTILLVGAITLGASAGGPTPPALAAEPPPAAAVHPIFVAVPDVPRADEAHTRFAAAVAGLRLGPVEAIDPPGPAAPRAAELLRTGTAALTAKRFAEAETDLDGAVAEALSTGGAGLDTAALADLFLHQGMAAQKADWKDLPRPLTEIAPPKAKQAYLRAAVLAPTRVLHPRDFPPIAVESWRLAVAEVTRHPRGSIVVRAPSSALISIDAGPPRPGLVPAADLCYGDHYIRVEDLGRQPWVAVVPLALQVLEIDAPESPALTVDDAEAAAHARRQGAAFALVAELGPARPARLGLRLVEASTGRRRDATTLAFPGDGAALVAAVMKLDEEARQARFGAEHGVPAEPRRLEDIAVAPVPPAATLERSGFADDPGAWARAHWPLVTAIGVAAGTALILGLMVARDDGP